MDEKTTLTPQEMFDSGYLPPDHPRYKLVQAKVRAYKAELALERMPAAGSAPKPLDANEIAELGHLQGLADAAARVGGPVTRSTPNPRLRELEKKHAAHLQHQEAAAQRQALELLVAQERSTVAQEAASYAERERLEKAAREAEAKAEEARKALLPQQTVTRGADSPNPPSSGRAYLGRGEFTKL